MLNISDNHPLNLVSVVWLAKFVFPGYPANARGNAAAICAAHGIFLSKWQKGLPSRNSFFTQ